MPPTNGPSTRAVMSFDIYADAPNPAAIRQGVQRIVTEHVQSARWVLSHLLSLGFANADAFNAFGKELTEFHNQPGIGDHFDFVCVGWVHGSGDVFFSLKPRPTPGGNKSIGAAPAMDTVKSAALARADEVDVLEVLNHLEVGLGFRSVSHEAYSAAPVVVHVGGDLLASPARGRAPRSSGRSQGRSRGGRKPRG